MVTGEKKISLFIGISVSYFSNLRRVSEILVEEAQAAVGEIPGLCGSPKPFVKFIPGLGKSSLDFTLICQVDGLADQYLADELRMRIFERLLREDIEIPFTQKTAHLRGMAS
ncbi:MAG: hypothetical protein A4E64_00492 [Syntrophorhabdus sp. PtaU1.Bin058]|nr:MAG: hypothetical protein A4E64_00492 [Syntrophorhabdus sp. PtaU1.Bin058]